MGPPADPGTTSPAVVRATDHDMGLRFENLSDEQKWALRKHIRDVQRDKS